LLYGWVKFSGYSSSVGSVDLRLIRVLGTSRVEGQEVLLYDERPRFCRGAVHKVVREAIGQERRAGQGSGRLLVSRLGLVCELSFPDLLGGRGCEDCGFLEDNQVLSWLSRLFDPISIAKHWPELELEGDLRRDDGQVLHAGALDECVHEIGRERLHHAYVPVVAAIIDEQVPLSIHAYQLRRVQQVLPKRPVKEARLLANTRDGVDLSRIYNETPDAIVSFVSDVSDSRFFVLLVLEILLAGIQIGEGYVLYTAEIDLLAIEELVIVS